MNEDKPISVVQDFYDQLAPDYHLIFSDWHQAMAWEAECLDNLIQTQVSRSLPLTLLDCACGIGTQAIGLAQRGYQVHGTDLSPVSVERTRQEAAALDVELTFGIADFRKLDVQVEGRFDVVLACDNALPHLLEDAELRLAAQNMLQKLNPGGLLLVSIRDYDRLILDKPHSTPVRVFDTGDDRRIVFQVWDWAEDEPIYTVNHFIVRPKGDQWVTTHQVTQYRALQREELSAILGNSGFSEIRWHMPDESGFYQPIVTARKAK